MERSHLIAVSGVLILLAALASVFWPADSNGPDQQAEQVEKSEVPEGVLLIDEKQIAASSIEIEAVQFGAATELVFPATVAAAPNASARIDARASGVVKSVNKMLGDYVRQGCPSSEHLAQLAA